MISGQKTDIANANIGTTAISKNVAIQNRAINRDIKRLNWEANDLRWL